MKVLSFTIVGILLMPLYVYATNIKGRFMSSEAKPYQILIENCDTTNRWNIESTFYDPSFVVNVKKEGCYTIKIIQHGETVFSDSLSVGRNNIDLGDIKAIKTIDISEIEVKAKKINIRHEGMDYIISNIQGTHLGDAGNLIEMLKWTPGISVNRNGQEETFDVIGKGTADIYVNGKKVKTSAELRGQKSNLVTKIEVIRNPDVQYSGSTKAVIRITTRRPLKDYLGAMVYNNTSFYRKVKNSSTIGIDGKHGIVSGSVSIGFDHSKSLSYVDKENVITHSTNDIYTDMSFQTTKSRSNYYNIFAGLNFDLSAKSVLAIQYSGGHNRRHPYITTLHDITDGGMNYEKEDESKYRYSDSRDNSYTAGYTYIPNSFSSLNLTASYTHKVIGYDMTLAEKILSKNKVSNKSLYSRDLYKYYTFDGDYTFKIKGLEQEAIGFHFGHIDNRNPYINNNVEQFSTRKDTWAAAYIKGQKKFSCGLILQLGLRYEYNNSKLDASDNDVMKTHSSFFIPEIRLNYRKKDKFFQLGYQRFAANPAIYELSPVVEYIDSLHCVSGNPSLKSYYGNFLSFSTSIKSFALSTSYSWGNKAPIKASILDEKTNIIKYMPINSDSHSTFNLNISYSINSGDGKYSSSFFVGTDYVTSSFTANNKKTNNRHGSFFSSANFSWSFIKNWRLYSNIFYQSKRMNAGYNYGYQLVANIGISTMLLKKKLRISLQGKDLFNRSTAPTETEFTYINVYEKLRNRFDSRGVQLSISYNFNNLKSKYHRAYSDGTISQRASGR